MNLDDQVRLDELRKLMRSKETMTLEQLDELSRLEARAELELPCSTARPEGCESDGAGGRGPASRKYSSEQLERDVAETAQDVGRGVLSIFFAWLRGKFGRG